MIRHHVFQVNRSRWRFGNCPPALFRAGRVDIFGSLALSLGISPRVLQNSPTLAEIPEEVLTCYPALMDLLRTSLYGDLYLDMYTDQISALNYRGDVPRVDLEMRLTFLLARRGFIPHFEGEAPCSNT